MMARAAVAEDFSHIEIQPMQALRGFDLNLATGIMILKVSHALTLLDAENRVMAIAGVIEKLAEHFAHFRLGKLFGHVGDFLLRQFKQRLNRGIDGR